ncbi:TorD/DmsD family molecular chaperone [Vibrio sp. S12_S33]|uniref:TorD/DmsD family molecular chaperone n=1 Tax=Vibrio sp. S12_S33 TaxID=2720223 RepID=UPI001780ECD2|nr:molecular chaperone TorD family protein [Vibrio sp. S12_S33]MBD1564801.1 dehydrogenase [Vibrio sp. S12_S33]
MKTNELNMQDLSVVLKVLGALFYYPPDRYQQVNLETMLNNVSQDIPLLSTALLAIKSEDRNELQLEHDRLFSGIGDMPAPPWGSVYLDKESIVFGESMLEYRQFLRQCGLSLNSDHKEPDDHIGLMLMVLGLLLKDERYSLAKELLQAHLITWFDFYIKRLTKASYCDAYVTLAESAKKVLSILIDRFQITQVERRDYFNDKAQNVQ